MRASYWLLLGALGCASGERECAPTELRCGRGIEEGIKATVEGALDPRATVLVDLRPLEVDGLRLRSWPLGDGSTLLQITGGTIGRNTFAVLRPDGGATELAVAGSLSQTDIDPATHVVVPMSGGGLLLSCVTGLQYLVRTDIGALDQLEQQVVGCSSPTIFGPSALPDQFVALTEDGGLRIDHYRYDGVTIVLEEPTQLPVGDPRITGDARFVFEREDGEVVWLSWDPLAQASWIATSASAAPSPVADLPAPPADGADPLTFRVLDGALAFTTEPGDRVDVIAPETGEVTTLATGEAPPEGFPEWGPMYGFGMTRAEQSEPNPYAAELSVPTGYAARAFVTDAFQSVAPEELPLTPCPTREACRALGESYLLGVFGFEATRVAVYALWTWEMESHPLVGIYAVPLEGDGGTSCEPGAGVCTDQHEGRRCSDDGSEVVEFRCLDEAQWCVDGGCSSCFRDDECPNTTQPCQVRACTANGCGFALAEVGAGCVAPDGMQGICDAEGNCAACAAEERRCQGQDVQVCAPDGSGFEFEQSCPLSCDAGQCADSVSANAVAAGGARTCMIASAGTVYCWGDGQVAPTLVPGLSNVTRLAVGPNHACAVTMQSQVSCWGQNDSGQLGLGTEDANQHDQPEPVTQSFGNILSLAVGDAHTCIGDSGNSNVYCWGSNALGQLGNVNSSTNSPYPQVVAALTPRTQVTAGAAHTCAWQSGVGLRCFGNNDGGQLGRGGVGGFEAAPFEIQGGGLDPSLVAAGAGHTCAHTTAGYIYCWGANGFGQIGRAGADSGNQSTTLATIPMTSQIAAGGDVTCVLAAGNVHCWGANDRGQLGRGSVDTIAHPEAAAVLTGEAAPALSGATSIAVGAAHVCAVVMGDVQCWGANDAGQLGIGDDTDRSAPAPVVFP